MGIRSLIVRGAQDISDGISKLASLSPEQLQNVQDKRNSYLFEKPDPGDKTATELTSRLLAACGVEIHQAYLSQIDTLYTPIDVGAEYMGSFDSDHNIRYFEITKWVVDPDEDSLEKLVNVYDVLTDADCNIALVFNRTPYTTHVYLAVVDAKNTDSNTEVNNYAERLLSAIGGNFPGSAVPDQAGVGRLPCMKVGRSPLSVASVTNIPAEKSERFISQTIEKVLDGVVPSRYRENYTIVLLATPVHDVEERKLRLAELYTALAPYSGWQTNYTYTESDTTSSSATLGVNAGVSAGVQNGVSSTVTNSSGESDSWSNAQSDSRARNISEGFSDFESDSQSVGVSAGANVGPAQVSANYSNSHSHGHSTSHTVGETVGKSLTRTLGRAITRGVSKATGVMSSVNFGVNYGVSFARSSTVTASVGKNEGITQSFTNYTIKHSLEHLESQMKRLDQATALGMWDFAAYVLSEDANVANNVAHAYLSLTQGEESYLSQAAINLWRGNLVRENPETENAATICSYLRDLRHPLFALNPNALNNDIRFAVYPEVVTATTALSGKELAYSLNFPRKSVPGLPVLECASFGRNVSRFDDADNPDRALRLGNVFHMHREETNARVDLSWESLSAHTFVTGSTGAGKTNAVCHMLDEALEEDISFLVIEPAKGEYKDNFDRDEDVSVYGTNPSMAPLLRINPFSFPKSIHVLEHLDRLVEVFNACWPMYAAMPAVLKDAIERSYADCGWDLIESTNVYGDDLYPSFADIARNVQQILDTSEYDAENKGAYKGSLLTRLRSLSNGLNGLVLTDDEILPSELFDTNVIIDLSRVGSSETKALLMGMLVLKLQEWRMSQGGANLPLRHITVLEEAHNLLRRTSPDQPVEAGNLLGKSVEMLANAIAEMRTYGEGFIIADQAPGLLDLSVIRNTNTKMILRLPEQADRELVGRAANLTDAQITELARLPRGVAAVYQNDWVEPVLCKVSKAEQGEPYHYDESVGTEDTWCAKDALLVASILTYGTRISSDDNNQAYRDVTLAMERLRLASSLRITVLRMLADPPAEPRMTRLAPVMSALFPTVYAAMKKSYESNDGLTAMTVAAEDALAASVRSELDARVHNAIIQGVITHYLYIEQKDAKTFQDWYKEGGLR